MKVETDHAEQVKALIAKLTAEIERDFHLKIFIAGAGRGVVL